MGEAVLELQLAVLMREITELGSCLDYETLEDLGRNTDLYVLVKSVCVVGLVLWLRFA